MITLFDRKGEASKTTQYLIVGLILALILGMVFIYYWVKLRGSLLN